MSLVDSRLDCRLGRSMFSCGRQLEINLSTDKSLSVWMALRYLASRGSALSYVSRLALLGLILSVAVLVIVLSVVNGFERELRERVLGVLPHMTAHAYAGLKQEQIDALPSMPGIEAIAAYVSGTALLSVNSVIEGASITGIEPRRYGQVTDIAQYTQQGHLDTLNDIRYGIILGAGLANKLHVSIGEQVLLVLPVGAVTPAGAVPRQRRFTVVDIFSSQSQLDSQSAYIELSAAQRLFRTGTQVHGVQARLSDLFAVEEPRRALRASLADAEVRVRSWMSTYGNLYQAIVVQKMTMFVLLSFLVGVAAFNLVSGLMMIVEQRKHDIAVLRTLGAQSQTVLWIFAALGLLLAITGIGIGMLVGIVFAYGLPILYSTLSQAFELNLMTQYFISYLPVDVRGQDLMHIGIAALVLALAATLFPAWQATRLLPSRVLAHE